MSRAAAAQSSQLTLTPVTLPTGQLVMSTQPHANKQSTPIDSNAILFLARFVALCNAEMDKVKFSQSGKVIDAYPVWNNVFQFLISPSFFLYINDRSAWISNSASFLGKFSAAIARPSFGNASLTSVGNALAYAALNADLDLVKYIVKNACPTARATMLSTIKSTPARMGGIAFTRTGTPLQLAIYDNDEEMAGYFKSIMDPVQFDRQSKAAFKNAISSEKSRELDAQNATVRNYFQAMHEQQMRDADNLCAEIKEAYEEHASWLKDYNYAADLKGLLKSRQKNQDFTELADETVLLKVDEMVLKWNRAIETFIQKLREYTQNKCVHNPHILYKLYDILTDVKLSDSFTFKAEDFFSQKLIGGAQSFLSARWLQHYAQGIRFLADKTKSPRRSFRCHHSNSDIRDLVSSKVGHDSCLDNNGSLISLLSNYEDEDLTIQRQYGQYLNIKKEAMISCYDKPATSSLHNPLASSRPHQQHR